jgi:hypothetical protein
MPRNGQHRISAEESVPTKHRVCGELSMRSRWRGLNKKRAAHWPFRMTRRTSGWEQRNWARALKIVLANRQPFVILLSAAQGNCFSSAQLHARRTSVQTFLGTRWKFNPCFTASRRPLASSAFPKERCMCSLPKNCLGQCVSEGACSSRARNSSASLGKEPAKNASF